MWVVGVAKTTTEVNQVVINTNCILQFIKRLDLLAIQTGRSALQHIGNHCTLYDIVDLL